MTLAPGTTLGRYQIVEPLGQGGMATVYKALQPSLDREIALKVLRPGFAQDPDFRERFEREAKAVAHLRHPHIVQVFDFLTADGHYALAMELLEGGTLKDRLVALGAHGKGMEARDTVRILSEVADALDYAHEQGVIHRDVKPSNVMLARKDRAVVTDFGIARILGATAHTQTGVGIGTPEYMAPEQGEGGHIDHRADIYSLGVMAYEMFVGRVPYVADTPLAVVLAHMKDPLPAASALNVTIGRSLERALARALEKEPSARYATAGAFADALKDGLARDAATGTLPTVVTPRAAAETPLGDARATTPRGAGSTTSPQGRASLPMPLWVGAMALAGIALLVGATQVVRSPAGPTAPPTPTVTASAAAVPVPARGQLFFSAKLDGTVADLDGIRTSGSPADAGFRPGAGAIEVFARRANAAAAADLRVPPPMPLGYVGELDLAVTPGSEIDINWTVRGTAAAGARRYLLQIRTKEQAMQLLYLSDAAPATLTDAIPIPGLQSGQRFTLGVMLDGRQIRLYLSGREVAQVTDDRVSTATGPPNIDVFASGPNGGSFVILGGRLYALP